MSYLCTNLFDNINSIIIVNVVVVMFAELKSNFLPLFSILFFTYVNIVVVHFYMIIEHIFMINICLLHLKFL